MIEQENLLERAEVLAEAFRAQLEPLVDVLPYVTELRICGLMIGLEFNVEATPLVQTCLDQGLLINCTQGNVIRLLPALTLSDEQLAAGCEILIKAIREYAQGLETHG